MESVPDMRTAALAWFDAGCSVIVVRADGSKAPLGAWRTYQTHRASREQVDVWFARHPPGIGVVCGAVSGGLEMLELEATAIAAGLGARLVELVTAAGLSDLWRRVAAGGYSERSPSGGIHLLYRVADAPVGRNTRLARRPATDAELAVDPANRIRVLAETRGEGGFTVVAPSHGTVHRSRQPWVALHGATPAQIPTIASAEREALVGVVRCLDAMPPATFMAGPAVTPIAGAAPGEDFERRTTWAEILQPAGWTLVHASGRTCYWRRPGKDRGVSATTGRADDRDRLFVFSTSTPFDTEVPITKFHAYAVLEHAGDHGRAASALRRLGYGDSPQHPGLVTGRSTDRRVRVEAEAIPHVAAWGPTEDGLARALVAYHGDMLRYCPQRGRWLVWSGHRWLWDDAEEHRECIRGLARQLPSSGGTWRRFRERVLSSAGVSGVARLARSDPAVTVPISALDTRGYELNTPGGIVDLRTGTAHPPDPAHLHTRSTPVAADVSRRSEVFERFLSDTFGDDGELARYVQRLLGLSAMGAVVEQVLPFAHGPGANGKSTLLEAAMHALGRGDGGYCKAASSDLLMVRRHPGHPTELAALAGTRLVVCSELEDGQRFAEARVKQLTGRDSISARFMRQDWFTFTPSHTLWLLGNHRPQARSGGPAFWRRVRLVPFTHVIAPDRQDRALGERLAEDAAAVLAWIVRGAAAYHRDGLSEPAAVVAATEAYARDQDTVRRFVEEQCQQTSDQSVLVGTTVLREAYERWCGELGETPVSAKRLTQELRDRFGVADARGSKGRRLYRGICLAAAAVEEDLLTGGGGESLG